MNNDEIITLYNKWQSIQPLPKANYQALWQWIRMHFNHLSNNFEGNTLTYSETQLLLIHGRTTGDHTLREYDEMKAHNIAFDYICKLAKQNSPIREFDIRDLNKICLKEPFYKITQTPEGTPARKKIIPGQYKKQPNHVLTPTGEIFHFAPPESTSPLMKDLTSWIQSWLQKPKPEQQKTLVSFLAELHKRFIFIHPFDDGNGRVIRLIINYVLIKLGFLPIVLNNREEYIKAIQFSDTANMSYLEKLFTHHITLMLKKGIDAQTNIVKLKDPHI